MGYNKKADGTTVSSFAYTHDLVGNRRTMSIDNNRAVITYTYNAAYELTSELRTGQDAYSLGWSYDGVGNRLTQVKNGVTTNYTCNDANQLLSEVTSGVSTGYQYDANGNLISKTLNSTTYIWTYNYENRQVAYNDPDNNKDASYVYDAEGRRIAKTLTVSGTTEKYLYDGANIIADYSGANVLKATYLTPFLDQNLLTIQGGDKWYYMQDGLGSVRSIVKGQSEKISYDYYAFGEMLRETIRGQIGSFYNRYKFTSREWDNESSLYYYRARYDDPYIGRFLSADPIGYEAGINLYAYVKNNPANNTDPSGLIETTSVPNPTHSMLLSLMPICLDPIGGGKPAGGPKKCCGVESFTVLWNKLKYSGPDVLKKGYTPIFALLIFIEFKTGGGFDPSCCEYKQRVKSYGFWTVDDYTVFIMGGDWHDDGYSRKDDWFKRPYSSQNFITSDAPGFKAPLGENVYVFFSFSAEQIVYDTCNGNAEVAKRGPHTATTEGYLANLTYKGVPKTLDK